MLMIKDEHPMGASLFLGVGGPEIRNQEPEVRIQNHFALSGP